MGRLEDRIIAKKEKNSLVGLCKVQKKFIPELFGYFEESVDPRNPAYITYSNRVMLGQMYFKGIAGLVSMQGMTSCFNDEQIAKNLSRICGNKELDMLPHHVTENEYLERLDPNETQGILHRIARRMIRRKTFCDARFKKKWLVIIDGTQLYSGGRQINGSCLETRHGKGTAQESVVYHQNVLEAKIYLGNNLVLSIMSEFIENSPEKKEEWKGLSPEKIKQDCETKAFYRLAVRLKEAFPKLPILILADSLYATEPVLKICRENGWDYLIRFKNGSIPSIAEEVESLRKNEDFGKWEISGQIQAAEFINGIQYQDQTVNYLHYSEKKRVKKADQTTEFQWLTSLSITRKNAEKMAGVGRRRWKIENQGFNRQKNKVGDITHACSWNANALKNHYLITQISDFVRQLYEYFRLEKLGIKRTKKNISSTLLSDLGELLTGEDIFNTQPQQICGL